MSDINSTKELLFGIIALQNNFISRAELIAAFDVWVLDKSRRIADILKLHGALGDDEFAALSALVALFLKKHEGDAVECLRSLSPAPALQNDLSRLNNVELNQSLAHVGAGAIHDPNETTFLLPTQSELGRFRVLRPHAQGGLGQVSVALDTELNREVALKQIQPQHADVASSRERFLIEAEITGGLEHPGIVPVYALGRAPDGRPFYAMRFVRGDSLKAAIEQFHDKKKPEFRTSGDRRLALRKLLSRFIDVCNAMEYAHNRGVLHRDLKPGNIMVGKYGETLVVDWGLAKTTNEHSTAEVQQRLSPLTPLSSHFQTVAGAAVGTPAYMSPEQALGKLDELGPTTDVYGLGATLYHLLCGRAPFTERDVGTVLRKVQAGDFPRPRSMNADIPQALEAVCLKAMALKPADRYSSARLLADDIERWLANDAVHAWREPFWHRFRRSITRNPSVVAASAAVILLLVTFATGWWFYERSQPAYLDLSVVPADSKVIIDGKEAKTEQGRVALTHAPGVCVVHISSTGYLERELQIPLVRGMSATSRMTIELVSDSGHFQLETDPLGADIVFENASGETIDRGVSPYFSRRLPAGQYTIRVSKDLYSATQVTVEVPVGGQTTVVPTVALRPDSDGSVAYNQFKRIRELLKQPVGTGSVPTKFEPFVKWLAQKLELEYRIDDNFNYRNLGQIAANSSMPLQQLLNDLQFPREVLSIAYLGSEAPLLLAQYNENASNTSCRVTHPVSDLVPVYFSRASQISRIVCRRCSPKSWESEGGHGTIDLTKSLRAIDVNNHFFVQVEIADYLDECRRSYRENPQNSGLEGELDETETDQSYGLRRLHLNQFRKMVNVTKRDRAGSASEDREDDLLSQLTAHTQNLLVKDSLANWSSDQWADFLFEGDAVVPLLVRKNSPAAITVLGAYREVCLDELSKDPEQRDLIENLAACNTWIGIVEQARGRVLDARNAYLDAVKLRTQLFGRFPMDGTVLTNLVADHCRRADLEMITYQFEVAQLIYDAAIKLLKANTEILNSNNLMVEINSRSQFCRSAINAIKDVKTIAKAMKHEQVSLLAIRTHFYLDQSNQSEALNTVIQIQDLRIQIEQPIAVVRLCCQAAGRCQNNSQLAPETKRDSVEGFLKQAVTTLKQIDKEKSSDWPILVKTLESDPAFEILANNKEVVDLISTWKERKAPNSGGGFF